MRRVPAAIRAWWARRTVQFRTSFVAAAVALVGLTLLARISIAFIGWFLLESVDTELRVTAGSAAERLAGGTPAARIAGAELRVLDTAGQAVDGRAAPELSPWELNELKAGNGVFDRGGEYLGNGDRPPQRWIGQVVPAPQGQPRLVLAGTGLVGHDNTLGLASALLWTSSVIAAGTVGAATWIVVRRSLRPVQNMRLAATSLPEGERLPVPVARDELRFLAEALNGMLAGRDTDTRRLRRFTGDAAHELRNPVASIRAQAEVAVVHPDPELTQDTLADIAEEAQRLSDLVESLLALSRAESIVPESAPVELAAAAQAAADRAVLAGSRPKVQLSTPTGAVVVLAAANEVATVLDNLLSNAARYARALVRLSVLPAGGGWVRLIVDDDGPGIPDEQRERVFDRFHRVESDRARRSGGAGIGLALVAEAVRRRGGSVHAGRSPEGGARIEVRWPAPGAQPTNRT